MAVRRSNIRRPMYQDNGAPRGYGQQSGRSPYLDREANNVSEALVGDSHEREPQRYEQPREPVARTQPVRPSYRIGEDEDQEQGYARPQVQDRWGRSPSHPHYGQDPMRIGQEKAPEGEDDGAVPRYGSLPEPQEPDYQLKNPYIGVEPQPDPYDGWTGPVASYDYETGNMVDSRGRPVSRAGYDAVNDRWQQEGWGEPNRNLYDEPEPELGLETLGNGPGALARYGTGNIPGANDVTWGDTSQLRGFNTGGWTNEESSYDDDTIKNTFGKIASRYPAKPSSLQLIVNDPDFKAFFPEATVDEKDKIDFGDGRPVDVLLQSDPNTDSAQGWAFQTMDGADGASGDMSGVGSAASWDEAYQMMRSLDPNLPQAEMEAALEAIFGGLPGYGGVYKESVMRDGGWQDLVGGYGGPNAQWQVLNKAEGGYGSIASPSAVQGALSPSSVNPNVDPNDSALQALLQQILLGNPEGQQMYNAYQNAI